MKKTENIGIAYLELNSLCCNKDIEQYFTLIFLWRQPID